MDLIVQQLKLYQTETFDECTTYTHWCKVEVIKDVNGELMYHELSQLAKTILCLSHANSDPERGFSENKYVLEDRGSLEEETIIAIRMVKDTFNHVSDEEFPINRRLLQLCSNARQKYFVFLEQKKAEKELLLKNQAAEEERKKKAKVKKSQSEKLSEIEKNIQSEGKKLDAAEGLIKDGNKMLSELINSKGAVDKKLLIKAQMLVQSGFEKETLIKSKMTELQEERNKLLTPKLK